jgi:hypothetical protein
MGAEPQRHHLGPLTLNGRPGRRRLQTSGPSSLPGIATKAITSKGITTPGMVAKGIPAVWFAHADISRVVVTQQNPFAEEL